MGGSNGDLDLLNRAGVRGVRFNFARFLGLVTDLRTVERVSRRVTELGWHVLLHVLTDNLLEHEAPFRSIPATFVIDHIDLLAAYPPDERARRKMLVDNPAKPCGFSDKPAGH